MGTTLFYDKLKSSLVSAQTLQEAEEIIQKEIEKVSGKFSIGFVVGKVSPTSSHETRAENLEILEKRTREIAEKELQKNVVVFSSSVIPSIIEESEVISEFYIFWEKIVRKYATIVYTTPGWESSQGAVQEITIAKGMGKEIKSFDEVVTAKI